MAINRALDQLYKRNILAVTKALSKRTKVTAILVTESACPNCHYDAVLHTGTGIYNETGPQPFTGPVCPVCENHGTVKVETPQRLPGANIKFLAKDQQPHNKLSTGYLPDGDVTLKIDVTLRPVLERADRFIIQGDGYSVTCVRNGDVISRGLLSEAIAFVVLKRMQ
jgi:hypothetical protein